MSASESVRSALREAAGSGRGGLAPYYADEYVTLYHGDCREILPSLGRFDAMVSDPPYGMNYKHGARKGGVKWGMDGQSIKGDDKPFDPSHLFGIAERMILWGGNHFASRLPDSKGWLLWQKRDPDEKDQSEVEMAWTNFLTTVRVFRRQWDGNVRGGREQAEGRFHVNQKPIALMQWCLGFLPPMKGEVWVVDPYAGSGATLIAAKELGIKAVGIELDAGHCATIATRCSQNVLDLGGAA